MFQRDAAGRITQATLPDGSVVGFGFDANGNLASLTPPGKPAHGFAYTPVDLTGEYAPPAAGLPNAKTQYAYNLDKQLTQVLRPDGAGIDVAYDSGGRTASVVPSAGAGDTVTYGYTAATGQLSAISNTSVTLGYTFDGALLKQETFAGQISGSIERTYDANFRVTGLALNGANVTLGYDRDSLLTNVGAMTLTRNSANGFLSGTTLGSVTTAQGYNAFGELASFGANYSSTPLYNFTLAYDQLGRIKTKTETISGVTTNYDYGYSLAGRLETVKQNGVIVTTYGYDANGNRTYLNGSLVGTYDDQDRLQSYAANTYTFGANGELKLKVNGSQTTQYSYDVFGNLKSVTLPDNTLIEYLVDGRNRRVGKKVNGSLTQGFLYQGQLQIVAELDDTGAILSRFIYGTRINVPEYLTKSGQTYRIVTDHLGSVRLAINSSTGAVAQRIDYDEFGNVLFDSNPGFQPFGFAGGLYEPQTKLVRFGARDYDAETGTWTTKDPIGFRGGNSNLYSYIGGNPVRRIDPSGLGPLDQDSGTGRQYFPWPTDVCIVGTPLNDRFRDVTLQGLDRLFNKPPGDAKDPDGAKAPGKPGEAEGFKDPKGGENWVPNPNPERGGSKNGWEDDKGNVWCPTGQGGRADGGPHWDVQRPDGGYDNVYPGGRVRPGR